MTRDSMKDEGEAKTKNCADKECTEDHFLFPIYLPRWSNEKIDSSTDKHDATEQMSP